jgi:methylmalonyl-CoA mutase C-terminal domain/subunit
MGKKIKVLMAKPGLDGHEMGARLITRCLMEAGMEVVYTGTRQTPEMVVAAALQEDVDLVALSFLSGSHKELTAEVVRLMKEKGLEDVALVVGGIIPIKDIELLKSLGAYAVMGPGSDTRVITQTVLDAVRHKIGEVDKK